MSEDMTDAELVPADVRSVIAADPTGIHPFRSGDLAVLMADADGDHVRVSDRHAARWILDGP